MADDVRRGDIVLVELDPIRGSEQAGTRPCIVLQNNIGNRYSSTTIIAPLTTQYDPTHIEPYEVELVEDSTVVDQDSVVLLNQIRTISVSDRVVANFGNVDPEGYEFEAIDEAIKISLGMTGR